MDTEYRTVASGPLSVLGASLLALGSEPRYIEAATGLELGVSCYRSAGDAHAISTDDAAAITEAIMAWAASHPDFWSDHIRRGTQSASHLVDSARALSTTGENQRTPAQLLAGFAEWTESVKEVAPFTMLTPLAGDAFPPGGEEPEARREIRNFYRLAVAILADAGAAGILRTTSASIGLRRIEEEHPGIFGQITRHVEDYGWLRSQGACADPMTAKDLVDRLQVVALRWEKEDIEHLARATPGDETTEAQSDSPFNLAIHLQAECVARPFLGRIATAIGSSIQQVLFSSPDEIAAALTKSAPLPTEEIDRRMRDGFIVERSGGRLVVSVDPNPEAGRTKGPLLNGMTACRGRAVGPLKVIRDEADLNKLRIGDVLVTAASTTDMMGGSTVFPTRGGGPPAVAKAIAVIADEGGLLSHAAIVCRERGIPCVLGTESATATLNNGDVVEVDATRANGTVLRYQAS